MPFQMDVIFDNTTFGNATEANLIIKISKLFKMQH